MKTITYNPETHVLVPREPGLDITEPGWEAVDWEDIRSPSQLYLVWKAMLAAAPQPEPLGEPFSTILRENLDSLYEDDGKPPKPVDVVPVGYVAHGSTMPRNIRVFKDCSILSKEEADEYMPECVTALYTTPQPDRTAELEAALKVARDALGSAKYVIEMAQLHKPGLKLAQQEALAKINEVLHD